MLRKSFFAIAAVVAAASQASAAFTPTTATASAAINDVILVSDISNTVDPAIGTTLQGVWGTGAITDNGEAILNGLLGPSGWGGAATSVNSNLATYTTNAGADNNPPIAAGAFVQNQYANQSLSTIALGTGIFGTSGPLIADADETNSATFFSHGHSEINNIFQSSVLSEASIDSGLTAVATANSINGTINLNLASAATIAALNGGSSTFTIRLYLNTLANLIDLNSDGPLSGATAGYTMSALLLGYSAADNGGAVNAVGAGAFADNGVVGGGVDLTRTKAGAPSTAGGLAATPFATMTVDAAVTRSISLSFNFQSQANVNPPVNNAVPEPASMLLFGTGLAGLGLVRRARNRKQAA